MNHRQLIISILNDSNKSLSCTEVVHEICKHTDSSAINLYFNGSISSVLRKSFLQKMICVSSLEKGILGGNKYFTILNHDKLNHIQNLNKAELSEFMFIDEYFRNFDMENELNPLSISK